MKKKKNRIIASSYTIEAAEDRSTINLTVSNNDDLGNVKVGAEYRQSIFSKNQDLLNRFTKSKFKKKIRFKSSSSPQENLIADLIQPEVPYEVQPKVS